MTADLQTLAINTIRVLSIDAVQKANSGHPGLPMGAAPMAYALWQQHLRHNPHNPGWVDRDRFILSAGHGSMLIYSLLYLTGYENMTLDEIKNFRQWGSQTPGHPESQITRGVEVTTGPLGQGTAHAVGMALAEAFLANYFNRPGHTVVDHYTYAIVSDGDLMEGISAEAASIAGTWGLGKLIYLYDSNAVTLDGKAEMIFKEDVAARYRAYGWQTLTVEDGNDVAAISAAIAEAKANTTQPTIITIKTIIGYGSPNKQGTSKAHGEALGAEEVKLVKEYFGFPQEDFYVPGEALEHWREAIERGAQQEAAWAQKFAAYRDAFPELAAEFERAQMRQLPDGWDADIPTYSADKKVATRVAGGEVLNAIAARVPLMIGGDADLAGSTRTLIKGADNTGPGKPAARNIRFGVREHAMGAIANGLALHGGIFKPYTATFLQFSDYMRPAMRLGALMEIAPVYIFTHDSIALGEDGPTHQPVEHVMSLRLIPHLYVFRPADANETAAAWRKAMTLHLPVAFALTRQNLPVLEGTHVREGVERGGYVLADCEGTPQLILLSSGSEVHLAHEAYKLLSAEGVRVRLVSLPCWELFLEQDATYREAVLPLEVTARVSIEAGRTLGWERWVGSGGITIGVDVFGASSPYERIYQEYGLTVEKVIAAARQVMGQ
ncbi:MAG: transketolase [Chloroflexota bacterium]|nr:transketolase [Chloroflexota bacterium]